MRLRRVRNGNQVRLLVFVLPAYLIWPRCHLGKSIVYDTVSNLSWSVDIRKHGIVSVIEEILEKPWQPSENVGREVPLAAAEEDCVVSSHNCIPYGTRLTLWNLQECYSWEFGDFPP